MQGMVGPEKIYASSELKEKHHVLDGISIDRFTMVMNTNGPLFSMPGQQEQMQAMWPGGKMEFDYALKGNQLFLSSPERMKDLLAGQGSAGAQPAGDPVGASTTAAGYMNLIQLMKFSMAANPMLPETVKKQFAQLNAEGTSLEFRVQVDRQLNSKLHLPLKLIQQFRTMGPPAPQPE
jgi:hypothetical protein